MKFKVDIDLSNLKLNLVPFIAACFASCLAIYWIGFTDVFEHEDSGFHKVQILTSVFACLPFGFLFERLRRIRPFPIPFLVFTCIVFLAFQISIYEWELHDFPQALVQSIALFILAHLLVAYLPIIAKSNTSGIWNMNWQWFLRFLLSNAYAATTQILLSLALVAIHELFEIKIEEEWYACLAVFSFGILAPAVFLSGNVNSIHSESEAFDYPIFLHRFLHYLIRSIMVLYFGILYVYIIVNWLSGELPSGILPYVILVFSAIVLLYTCLKQPNLSRNSEVKWIAYCMLPLLLVLFYGTYLRISDYGFTINRYLIVVSGIVCTLLYTSLILRNVQVKFFILILIPAIVVLSFGPLSVFNFPRKFQESKLNALIQESIGKPITELDTLTISKHLPWNGDTAKQIRNIIEYLYYNHNSEWLDQIGKSRFSLDSSKSEYIKVDEWVEYLRLREATESSYEEVEVTQILRESFEFGSNAKIPVAEYVWLKRFEIYKNEHTTKFSDSTSLRYVLNENVLKLYYERDSVAFTLDAEKVKEFKSKLKTPQDTFYVLNSQKFDIYIQTMDTWPNENSKTEVQNLGFYLAYKKRNN